MITVTVINESTLLTDAQVAPVVAALQRQVSEHFFPAWGIDARLEFLSKGAQSSSAYSWQLILLDTSDDAGALGYHDITPRGLPLGKVFVKSDLDSGSSWTVTLSHELLEMLGDPNINLTVLVDNILYAYEACDACEADELGYDIGGVKVSDFVYPAYFESFWGEGETQFDYGKHISAPLQLLPGGYASYLDITNGQGWQQKYADATPSFANRPRVGSRRERRRLPREQWVKSKGTI